MVEVACLIPALEPVSRKSRKVFALKNHEALDVQDVLLQHVLYLNKRLQKPTLGCLFEPLIRKRFNFF